ncbi:TIGR03749 family integrating conjugative element protein [Pseudomonas ficuserectae]|uniref:TIGR03749 family integrating conjugative element protein n=1 Tax=Pseudomonas ficuserectae TaxID=53410 RepID=UPI0006D616E4|nr:TIGR03749 family integrating conjugative element protein [Pseudomonas ficuserectae]KPX40520.1 hypothetical protein ALO69_200052 [Pseudomonas ficuserectae]RMS37771.1 hypothetical protein ALP68_200142 [Pseudomonas ficuserectae]
MRALRKVGYGCLFLAFSQASHAVEIVRWERLPLAIPLLVNQERIVFVDQNVRIGVPNSIKDDLRIQSSGGAVYLQASKAIPPTRLQLQVVGTGEIILVDIAAQEPAENQKPLEPMKIVQGEAPSTHYGKVSPAAPDADDETAEEERPSARETPVPVVLTRYAAQNLYAPLRTVEPLEGVSQVNLNKRVDLSTLLPSLPVLPTALGAWQMDDYIVTAVKLRNLSAQPLRLDPRELQGDFATATFQHNTLGTRGTPADTTVVYLVTIGKGIAGALLPSISPVDASANLERRNEK